MRFANSVLSADSSDSISYLHRNCQIFIYLHERYWHLCYFLYYMLILGRSVNPYVNNSVISIDTILSYIIMDSPIVFNVWGSRHNLVIMVKAHAEPTTFFRRTEYKELVDIVCQKVSKRSSSDFESGIVLLQDWFPAMETSKKGTKSWLRTFPNLILRIREFNELGSSVFLYPSEK